ncbi:MAG: DUF4251 domain-containing protein [Bacteroidales bacterium]|nr:DUF4251 domain-containing protein [Bacteroidales bacterium]
MKKIVLLLASVAMLFGIVGCGSIERTPEERAEAKQNMSDIKAALKDKNFTITADFIIPLRGGSSAITGGYHITVNGDELMSDLPYYGEAWSLPYGGGHGLHFTSDIEKMKYRRVSDHYEINLKARDTEGTFDYFITIYDTGRAEIQVESTFFDTVRYTGDFVF